MNVRPIIAELRKERARLDEAILALERISAFSGGKRLALELVRDGSVSAEERPGDPFKRAAGAR